MNKENINIKYFYFNLSYAEYFDDLTDEEVSAVMRCVLDLVRDRETHEDSLSSASRIVFKAMKRDIESARKKYLTKCENGRKGGIAKAKKSSSSNNSVSESKAEKNEESDAQDIKDTVLREYNYLLPDEENYDLLYRLFCFFDVDCNKCGFDYRSYFTKKQLAKILACYEIGNFENDINTLYDAENIKELSMLYGASEFCRELKEFAKEIYLDSDPEKDFREYYNDLEHRAELLLKLPDKKLKEFYYIGYACNEEWSRINEIENKFTSEQLSFIELKRKEKGYPSFTAEE